MPDLPLVMGHAGLPPAPVPLRARQTGRIARENDPPPPELAAAHVGAGGDPLMPLGVGDLESELPAPSSPLDPANQGRPLVFDLGPAVVQPPTKPAAPRQPLRSPTPVPVRNPTPVPESPAARMLELSMPYELPIIDTVPTRAPAAVLDLEPPPPAPPLPFAATAAAPASAPAPAAPSVPAPKPPLLIDVTPLTLNVETVGGFCDALIEANTPVPCDRTRVFLTASDNQTSVFVRVAQGPSPRFAENTFLGELELSGITPMPRGEVAIAVTFEIDADGILNVRATDQKTGKQTRAKIQLVGAAHDEGDLEAMRARQARHAVV
jgi:molecular chaperone DnaK